MQLSFLSFPHVLSDCYFSFPRLIPQPWDLNPAWMLLTNTYLSRLPCIWRWSDGCFTLVISRSLLAGIFRHSLAFLIPEKIDSIATDLLLSSCLSAWNVAMIPEGRAAISYRTDTQTTFLELLGAAVSGPGCLLQSSWFVLNKAAHLSRDVLCLYSSFGNIFNKTKQPIW